MYCSCVSNTFAAPVRSLTASSVHPLKVTRVSCWQVRMMCQFVNVLDVTVLPVYRPSAEEVGRPELFAANVRAVFVEAGGMCAAEQSQREFLALTKVDIISLVRRRTNWGSVRVASTT